MKRPEKTPWWVELAVATSIVAFSNIAVHLLHTRHDRYCACPAHCIMCSLTSKEI